MKLGRVEIVAQAEALTRLNGLRSGGVELALLDGQTFPNAEDADGLATEQFFTTTNQHLQFNRTRAEFDNKLVRQAMNYAIDRQAIVDVAYNGYGHALSQFYSPDFEKGYVEGLDRDGRARSTPADDRLRAPTERCGSCASPPRC